MATASRTSFGIFPVVVGTTKALQRRGHLPQVLATSDEFTLEDRHLWANVPVETFRSVGPQKLFLAPQLPGWFRHHPDFDLVSIHGVWGYLFAAAARYARRSKVPLVLTPHGMLEPWALQQSRRKKRVAQALYVDRMLNAVDCFHVNSEMEAGSIRQLGIRKPIAIVPHGVDLPDCVPSRSGRRERTLLFLGRIHKKKAVRELVDAWLLASASAPNWRLVIAGPDEQGLVAELKELTRGKRVEFAGPVFGARKRALYETADAFTLPSHSEGFPMTVLEAWSYALPVLKTDACNMPEGFAAGAALRVTPTVANLAASLKQLFALPEAELRSMGQHGQELVRSRYSWDRVAQDLAVVYDWLRGKSTNVPFNVHQP